MTKAPRTSVQRAVEALQEARVPPPDPPAHVRLRPGDLPFWRDVLDGKGAVDWCAYELPLAAQLARAWNDLQRESDLLDREPKVFRFPGGQTKQNPRVKVIESISARALLLARQLRVHHGVARPQVNS